MGEIVLFLEAHRCEPLANRKPLHRANQIPIMRGGLKLLPFGGFAHALLQSRQEILVSSLEKEARFLRLLPVILPFHQPGAGARALVELVVEAGARTASIELFVA